MIKVLYFISGLIARFWLNLPKEDRHFFYYISQAMDDGYFWLQTKILPKNQCSKPEYCATQPPHSLTTLEVER
jgi:hypothetical protein